VCAGDALQFCASRIAGPHRAGDWSPEEVTARGIVSGLAKDDDSCVAPIMPGTELEADEISRHPSPHYSQNAVERRQFE